MNDAELSELKDKAMAGRLTPEEEVRWNGLLAERPELEEDMAVGRALQALPPPPKVSSNFTAVILGELRLEERARERGRVGRRGWSWLRWAGLARASGFAAVAILIGFSISQFQENLGNKEHNTELAARTFAGEVNKVVDARKEPAPETVVAVFKDFDAIRNLSESSEAVDYDLLKALGSGK